MKAAYLLLLVAGCYIAAAQARLIGGGSTSEPVTAEVTNVAAEGIKKLNANAKLLHATLGNHVKSVNLVKVQSVKTQVVQGKNYYLSVQVQDNKKAVHALDIVVWARPWLAASNSKDAYQLTKAQETKP